VQHRQVGHRWVKYEQTKIFYIGGSILINLYGSVSASVEGLCSLQLAAACPLSGEHLPHP